MQTNPRDIATTLLKGIDVLRAFEDSQCLTTNEIAERTGQSRATARRLCLTLVQAGLLNHKDYCFYLTARTLPLAGSFLRANGFGLKVSPIMAKCADSLTHGINLAMNDGTHALIVAREITHGSRTTKGLTIGARLPLHATALGMALLSQGPDGLLERLHLRRFTEKTVTNPTALRGVIAEVRRSSVSVEIGGWEEDVVGIAVPVGESASIGTSYPSDFPDLDAVLKSAEHHLKIAAEALRPLPAMAALKII